MLYYVLFIVLSWIHLFVYWRKTFFLNNTRLPMFVFILFIHFGKKNWSFFLLSIDNFFSSFWASSLNLCWFIYWNIVITILLFIVVFLKMSSLWEYPMVSSNSPAKSLFYLLIHDIYIYIYISELVMIKLTPFFFLCSSKV